MKVKQFEDLEIWQMARELINKIYGFTKKSQFNKDFGLRDQIQRASVSIMNNIAEGFEKDNNKEFKRYLLISKGSAGEVRSLLYVAFDLGYLNQDEFNQIYNESIILTKKIAAFIKYLKEYENKNL